MTDLSWVADENGVALHMPDPTGLTLGVTVTLPPEQVEAIYTCMRSAQLGADTTGDL